MESGPEGQEQFEEYADSVAIIGMSGRFPGARDLRQFWQNLRGGVESISFFSDEELEAAGVAAGAGGDASHVRAGGVLQDIEMFDAPFFGFSAEEAAVTDPQQRLFLECAWEALEAAGYNPDAFGGRIGLFAGATISTYLLNNLLARPASMEAVGRARAIMRNDLNFLATLAAYKLNLKGPALTVQTACSTSLVAVHLACQSLLGGECDITLAGATSVSVPQVACHEFREGGIHSPDGRCRPFDAEATGTVGGSGVGVVALKRAAEALADGDNVLAIIRGSAINNDGSLKVGYTAPGVQGQAAVIREALAVSGLRPDEVAYVEAHGTATPLGDQIEVSALRQAYGDGEGVCALGSVKGNIGHLDVAAGMAGLFKAALTVREGELVPSLHFKESSPQLGLGGSRFRVNTRLREFAPECGVRRAGVSSFGIGGTNAHLIIEEAPPREPDEEAPDEEAQDAPRLLVLSARSRAALEAAGANLAAHVRENASLDLADVAYTLQVGRKTFAHRRALVCDGRADALEALGHPEGRGVLTAYNEGGEPSVALLFTQDDAAYVEVGRGLYAREPLFRKHVDECARTLLDARGPDLREALTRPSEATTAGREGLTRPAVFAAQYALGRWLLEAGVRPAALLGRGFGEYAAACLAGVLTPEAALRVVAAAGLCERESPSGVTAEAADRHLGPMLAGVALSAPSVTLVSGAAGKPLTPEEATDPTFWARLPLAAERVEEAIRVLRGGAQGSLLLEVGAGRFYGEAAGESPVSAGPKRGERVLLEACGRLWLAGVELDWKKLYDGRSRRRVGLPTYPFERNRYWV